MKIKYILALTAVLAVSQASALTAIQKQQGCNGDIGNCPSGEGPAGGGGGGQSTFLYSVMVGDTHWETYSDADGEWDIETKPDGTQKVYFWDNAPKSAMLVKKPPAGAKKRSLLVTGPFSPSLSKAQIQAKAEAEAKANAAKAAGAAAAGAAAQAAAQKAAADAAANKAAAEAAAKQASGPRQAATPGTPALLPVGIVVNSQPAVGGNLSTARPKP
jgi:hypothetical protein